MGVWEGGAGTGDAGADDPLVEPSPGGELDIVDSVVRRTCPDCSNRLMPDMRASILSRFACLLLLSLLMIHM